MDEPARTMPGFHLPVALRCDSAGFNGPETETSALKTTRWKGKERKAKMGAKGKPLWRQVEMQLLLLQKIKLT